MSGIETLLRCEDHWETEMGAWFAGENVIFRGKGLFTDLYDKSWMEIWMYSITEREFTEEQMALWNRLWVLCTSFPEPRIWNNRVAALSGTAKSTAALAVSAATAVSEAKIYGRQADVAAYEFITHAHSMVEDGHELGDVLDEAMKVKRVIPPGFGRPMISVDERIPPVIQLVKDLGLEKGTHFQLSLKLDKFLIEHRKRLRLNIGGLVAAIAADQGLSIREYYHYVLLCCSAGNHACYQDASEKVEGTFFPIRCERVVYNGVQSRKWENPRNSLD